MAEKQLKVTRRFDASPERVFDAWLDPKLARRFLFTTADTEVVVCEIDARPGGRFRIVDRRPEEDIEHVGEYLEIDRPHRLVFTFGVPQYDPNMTTVTLEIRPDGAGSELTLLHDGVPPEWQDQTVGGWTMILDAQATALG